MPPSRRRRADIPHLAEINSHGKLPKSREADPPGNPAPREIPWCISREIGCRIRLPGKFTGEFPGGVPGKLATAARFPVNFPGNWLPRRGSRGIPREIREPLPDFAVFCHSVLELQKRRVGESGTRAIEIPK